MQLSVRYSRVDECVEMLCQRGCREVYGVIGQLQCGNDLPETTRLTPTERQHVLDELVSIMAVYDGTCPASR